jgi:predicted HicB family RNase H-like nuclease
METPLIREKLTLRLPPELHQRLKPVAVDNGRSLNAEIVQRLRRSFDDIGAPEGSEMQ